MHGFVWLEGAPSVMNLSLRNQPELDAVIAYFDQFVSALNTTHNPTRPLINPCKLYFSDVDEHQMYASIELETQFRTSIAKHLADYTNLINTVQRHTKCTASCLRKKRNRAQFYCRCKYPKELVPQSKIVFQEEKFKLDMKRNDARMNAH